MPISLTEELTIRYYLQRKYLVAQNVRFLQPKGKDRKVGGWSDVDVLATDGEHFVIAQCKGAIIDSAEVVVRKAAKWFGEAEKFCRDTYGSLMRECKLEKRYVTFLYSARQTKKLQFIRDRLDKAGIELVNADEMLRDMFKYAHSKLEETPEHYGKEDDPMLDLIKYLAYLNREGRSPFALSP